MSFYQNACKPKGLAGAFLISMMNRGHASMAAWGLAHIRSVRPAHSLDIGCGGGANLKQLMKKNPAGTVTGIDYSAVSVKKSIQTNRKAIKEGRCQVLQGSAAELPFPDESFGLATAFETVYFWSDIRTSFAEVYRVLEEGGTFFICNETDGTGPAEEKWMGMIEGMTVYDANDLKVLLREAGFVNIRSAGKENHWLCLAAEKPKKQNA